MTFAARREQQRNAAGNPGFLCHLQREIVGRIDRRDDLQLAVIVRTAASAEQPEQTGTEQQSRSGRFEPIQNSVFHMRSSISSV